MTNSLPSSTRESEWLNQLKNHAHIYRYLLTAQDLQPLLYKGNPDYLTDLTWNEPVDQSMARTGSVTPPHPSEPSLIAYCVTMSHQLDHSSGNFFTIEVRVTNTITSEYNPVAPSFSQFFIITVAPHSQMLQAALLVLVEVLLVDRWHVIVLCDDFDLLIAGIDKSCGNIHLCFFAIDFAWWADVFFYIERANASDNPILHRFVNIGRDLSLLNNGSK